MNTRISRRIGSILTLAVLMALAARPASAVVNAAGLWALSYPSPGGVWQLRQDGASVEGSTTSGQYAYFGGTARNAAIGGITWLAQGPPPNIPYQSGYLVAAVIGNKLSGIVFWYIPLPVVVPVTGTRLVP